MSDTRPPVVEPAPPAAARLPHADGVAITVLMPAYNEAPNLVEIVPRTLDVLQRPAPLYEVVVVDDGSHDGTAELMAELGTRHPELRLLRLRRNYGKSTALQAGFDHARGDVIVLMDADGQDQPEEIPKLLGRSTAGSTSPRAGAPSAPIGWSSAIHRASTTASRPPSPGVAGEDFNSGLKAMKREVMSPLVLYGELHRYIPVLAEWAGFRVGEVDVSTRRGCMDVEVRPRALLARVPRPPDRQVPHHIHGRPFHLFGGLGALLGVDRRRAARMDVRLRSPVAASATVRRCSPGCSSCSWACSS